MSNEAINDNDNIILPVRSSISSCQSNTVLSVPPNPPPPPPQILAVTPFNPSPLLLIPPPPPLSVVQAIKEEIKIKVENERLLQHLVKLGNDRTKSACALTITNYNLDFALEILNKYANKF